MEWHTKKPLNRISVPRQSITLAESALTTGVRINTISTAHDCDIEDLPRSEATCIRGVSDIAHFLMGGAIKKYISL